MLDEGRKHLELARQLDAKCPLIARAERETTIEQFGK